MVWSKIRKRKRVQWGLLLVDSEWDLLLLLLLLLLVVSVCGLLLLVVSVWAAVAGVQRVGFFMEED